jgi:hypothetical protein
MNGHLADPYLAGRLRAPVLSLALGSCLVPASTAVLHASLSSAFFSLRQVGISSALGMNALQTHPARVRIERLKMQRGVLSKGFGDPVVVEDFAHPDGDACSGDLRVGFS